MDETLTRTRLRRRKYFMVRVADEPQLDVARFFRGEVEWTPSPRCTLLCPVRGDALPLAPDELALAVSLPADRWVALDDPARSDDERRRLHALAQRGVLVADPPVAGRDDLDAGEATLDAMQWHDVAAVYQAHSQWRGVVGRDAFQEHGDDASRERLDALRDAHGPAPTHFVRRDDAVARTALALPALDDPFFATLRARRTTRHFRADVALPRAALETMLYATFGVQGTKTLAPGVSAVKRTSASGGGLHPVEAYVLAIDVDGIPSGLHHYETATHALALLEPLERAAARDVASAFTAGQAYFAEAHALVVHVARFDRHFWKYARHRKAYKAVLMDSAHLSQTFYLVAARLGLGAFYTAAINDADIAQRLRLPAIREAAVGISGVGVIDPARDEMHFVPEPYVPTGIA